MPRYDFLRTLAFRINPQIADLPHHVYTLAFPATWKQELKDLQARLTNRPSDKVTLPMHILNTAIRALVSDVIAITRSADRADRGVWLYSTRPIDPDTLLIIIHTWIHIAFEQADLDRRNKIVSDMKARDLKWEELSINLADWHINNHGTAQPTQTESFLLLPHYLAQRISKPGASLEFGEQNLAFRRASLPPGESGSELISWPPILAEDNRGVWPYSLVLTLTAQTVPFQSFPVVHADVGIRRWAGSQTRLPGGNSSVYLLTRVPWIRGLEQSPHFTVAPLGWVRDTAETVADNQPRFIPLWKTRLTDMLQRLSPQHPFPDPQALLDNPHAAIHMHGTPNAALVFRSGMRPNHYVSPGLMVTDRRQIAEQLESLFAPDLQFVSAPERVKFSVSRSKNPFYAKISDKTSDTEREQIRTTRYAILGRVLHHRLTIEIWFQSSAVHDALIDALCTHLDVPVPDSLPATWSLGGMHITLQSAHLGAMGRPLRPDRTIRNKGDRIRRAIAERGAEIAQTVKTAQETTVSLIELDAAEKFDGEADPKLAIRGGFAQAERLSQFITPHAEGESDTSVGHRARQAILDLFRQIGVQVDLPQLKGLPEPLTIVGAWLINKRGSPDGRDEPFVMPVLVRIQAGHPEITAIAPGLGTAWQPYGAVLRALARGKGQPVRYARDALPFLQEKLVGDVFPLGNTVIVCHAQNMRLTWPWLQDKQINTHAIEFGSGQREDLHDWPGLRIIRVRSNLSHETPEWYAQNPDEDEAGFAKGLFRIGNHVFASTYSNPSQFKVNRSLSKGGFWSTSQTGTTLPPRPNALAWNPGLFEVTTAILQPEDKAELWAALVHELRHTAVQFEDAMALPLPLHLARLMEEYIIRMDEEDEE